METRSLKQFFSREGLFLRVWLIFSIPFVFFTLWARVEQGFYQQGLRVGSKRAAQIIYNDIIAKANNQECKTIFVEQSGQKVDMINVNCLRQKAAAKDDKSVADSKKTHKIKGSVN